MGSEAINILLTGANGQVGFELRRSLAPLGRVIALDRQQCDLADESSVVVAVTRYQPQVIVNAAAWTAVDRAETESGAAYAVNAVAPALLARLAAESGALLLHFSTDYVFDGALPGAYRETDIPAPLSVYGASKLAGEQAVALACTRHLIFRCSWVFGAHGANFMKTVLCLANERRQLGMVSDQFGAPTGAALIADVSAQVLAQYLRSSTRESFAYGLYHLTASGVTHWQQYARYVVEQAEILGCPLMLKADDITSIATTDYPLPAPRPANSCLDTRKLRDTFGLTLPPWQEGVRQALTVLLA